ncbi:hypothetical protein TCK1_2472 [Pseudomonas monteilii]|jgi:hypothetical protein|uniref:Uncharacterized protein n=1 Tax=Pseudomonas monteilii TaxID=76759 RepID=A0AAE6V268_9PSED|nr:hypothetical protein TCK1_2472 [Pseudomonas monteilii]
MCRFRRSKPSVDFVLRYRLSSYPMNTFPHVNAIIITAIISLAG